MGYLVTYLIFLKQGYFLMLLRQSGTLSLTKSGHPTPSHTSNHHSELIFFSNPTDCGAEERKKEGGERGGERERTSGLSQSVRVVLFFIFILFHVMGLVLQRRNGTEKNT